MARSTEPPARPVGPTQLSFPTSPTLPHHLLNSWWSLFSAVFKVIAKGWRVLFVTYEIQRHVKNVPDEDTEGGE